MKKLSTTHCGYIGIFGRKNAGKSTLLNKIVGEKISITSRIPGTTINNIIGIKTINNYQTIYIDTPGITTKKNVFFLYNKNNFLIKKKKLRLIIFVIHKTQWSEIEDIILKKIKKFLIPIILVINKIDLIDNKKKLLPFINIIKEKYNFLSIIPISAKTQKNISLLLKYIKHNIPKANHDFPHTYTTNSSLVFRISEIIREKFIRFLGQELPYNIKVKIDTYNINYIKKTCFIYALILVNNNRHKKIIIGQKGEKIKLCSILARKNIEKIIQKKIYLKIWVQKTM
ncbi:GTPase Era [Buchnera aphidicola]|uniref:GTPase Era n=1 Tax=Buchnera aphidicola (Stegophylla sp.) TaxID=2315800 RepID=A0A4D6YK69_9GAMM|nr:GTPase Era [Buchnera aphidicola (Stegophylla sp.)]QCI26344.1 GTPase Era [Buchnera aphidicola (Stegophylla sp.)]